MFDSIKELLDKIRLGEDSFMELKEVRFAGDRVSAPHRDSLADELAAMANSRGGVVLLGVDDATRAILGIPAERLDAVESFVRELCNDSVAPPLLPVIDRSERRSGRRPIYELPDDSELRLTIFAAGSAEIEN